MKVQTHIKAGADESVKTDPAKAAARPGRA